MHAGRPWDANSHAGFPAHKCGQWTVCYNLHTGHGQMLRVAKAPLRIQRINFPFVFLSIQPRHSVMRE